MTLRMHLVKSYSGKVKVIYIDPPYNTGSDGFVYNDKFNFTAEDLAKRLDVSPERAERILSMTSSWQTRVSTLKMIFASSRRHRSWT